MYNAIWTLLIFGVALWCYLQMNEIRVLYLAVIGVVVSEIICAWRERAMRWFWLKMAMGTIVIWIGVMATLPRTDDDTLLFVALGISMIHTPVLYWIDKITAPQ